MQRSFAGTRTMQPVATGKLLSDGVRSAVYDAFVEASRILKHWRWSAARAQSGAAITSRRAEAIRVMAGTATPPRDATSRKKSARETENPLRDHVPLDLGGPAHDGLRSRVEVRAAPPVVLEGGRTEDVDRELLEALVGLAAEDLLDRALDARLPRPEEPREAPVPGQAEELDLDPCLREPLAEDRVGQRRGSRSLARLAHEPLEAPAYLPLERERPHR